ncbi:ParA family protein [Microbacteriaceae bacterium K1510]|nr:ParA family protein [Microbacteriaceae bacterium K1510]
MMSVGVTNYKGGTGKSTTGVHLAVAAACRGYRTILVDTDAQGSAIQWARRRTVDNLDLRVIVTDAERLSACIADYADRTDFCVVDTPGHDWKALSCAAVAVDLSLIVTRPAQFDAETALKVRDAFREFKLAHAFLISQAAPRISRKSATWVDAYAAQGQVVSTRLTYLTAFQDAIALGLGVKEFEPYGRAAAEVDATLDWVVHHFKERCDLQA